LIQELRTIVLAGGLGEIGTELGAVAADAMAGMTLGAAFLEENLTAA